MTMLAGLFPVRDVRAVAENTYVLSFRAAPISQTVRAGQFLNIRVDDATVPLLRRPFSVHRTDGDIVEFIFNVVGRGTLSLSRLREGDEVDVVGPLGVPFTLGAQGFRTAILIGGGLGVAPLPLATATLRAAGTNVETFLGARSARFLAKNHLENLHVATDDGTEGFHGTVVDLLMRTLEKQPITEARMFACGPMPMLRAAAALSLKLNIPCEVSLEGPMGCGIGICQGCPVELTGGEKKYALMCKDGPTFDVRKVRL